MLVRVYRNDTRGQWAVVNAKTRRVAFYADELTLVDVKYHCGPEGRICKSGHKNRHNYLEGRLRSFSASNRRTGARWGEQRVEYRNSRWRTKSAWPSVFRSQVAELTNYGVVYMECDCQVCSVCKFEKKRVSL